MWSCVSGYFGGGAAEVAVYWENGSGLMKKSNQKKCAQCGHKGLEPGVVERTIKVPAEICPDCGAYRVRLETLRRKKLGLDKE
jgi:hypothetical protein